MKKLSDFDLHFVMFCDDIITYIQIILIICNVEAGSYELFMSIILEIVFKKMNFRKITAQLLVTISNKYK